MTALLPSRSASATLRARRPPSGAHHSSLLTARLSPVPIAATQSPKHNSLVLVRAAPRTAQRPNPHLDRPTTAPSSPKRCAHRSLFSAGHRAGELTRNVYWEDGRVSIRMQWNKGGPGACGKRRRSTWNYSARGSVGGGRCGSSFEGNWSIPTSPSPAGRIADAVDRAARTPPFFRFRRNAYRVIRMPELGSTARRCSAGWNRFWRRANEGKASRIAPLPSSILVARQYDGTSPLAPYSACILRSARPWALGPFGARVVSPLETELVGTHFGRYLTAYVLVDILPISLALPTGSVSTCIIFRSQQVHTGVVTLIYQPGQVSFSRWGLEPGGLRRQLLVVLHLTHGAHERRDDGNNGLGCEAREREVSARSADGRLSASDFFIVLAHWKTAELTSSFHPPH
ncbi:hypothetical protein C8J57DRAFT_1478369 [Mycena rebaudengoi]|nr:hypothetical protein C8J57DRAFT_1478369 [Mycena rebaudengoi]